MALNYCILYQIPGNAYNSALGTITKEGEADGLVHKDLNRG